MKDVLIDVSMNNILVVICVFSTLSTSMIPAPVRLIALASPLLSRARFGVCGAAISSLKTPKVEKWIIPIHHRSV